MLKKFFDYVIGAAARRLLLQGTTEVVKPDIHFRRFKKNGDFETVLNDFRRVKPEFVREHARKDKVRLLKSLNSRSKPYILVTCFCVIIHIFTIDIQVYISFSSIKILVQDFSASIGTISIGALYFNTCLHLGIDHVGC